MKKTIAFFVLMLLVLPGAISAGTVQSERAALIYQYLQQIGCLNAAGCATLAGEVAGDGPTQATSMSETADFVMPARTTVVSLAAASAGGNGLLQHLPTLFVLDSLFQNESSGLITPGPATLANVIVLYELFYESGVP